MLDIQLLKSHVEKRDYQLQAAQNAIQHNTLVVMPTALGKTFVAAFVAAHFLATQPEKKILFLAPTKPLVDQQAGRMREVLQVPAESVVAVTGDVSPEERQLLYPSARIIAGTPQTVEHDVLARKLLLSDFSLVVFDEAHRAVGEYAYVFLGEMSRATPARILGLTASPSSQKEKIQLICENLGIKHLELRRESDPSVSKYASPVKVDFVFVDLPAEFKVLQNSLHQMLSETLGQLKEMGFADSADPRKTTKREMLAMRAKIAAALAQKNMAAYKAASLNARAMNLSHGLDLLESQGVDAFHSFLLGLKERKTQSKAVAGLVSDFRITQLIVQCDELLARGVVHPKIARLKAIVDEQVSRGKTLIVFAHFRDTAKRLSEDLSRTPGVKARMLVGRAGMSQKKQKALLDQFRAKEFNVLVATSLGPNEFIVLKRPDGRVELVKIGEFVDGVLGTVRGADALSKPVTGWCALTTDGKTSFFKPITHVHRHKRRSNLVNVRLNQGFDAEITEDHSLMSFDSSGGLCSVKPKNDTFIALSSFVEDHAIDNQVNLLKELNSNLPLSHLDKLYCSFDGFTQPRIRELKSDLGLLRVYQAKNVSEISTASGLSPSTVWTVMRRLARAGYLFKRAAGRECFVELTDSGMQYLDFLNWFFSNVRYYKKKYRSSVSSLLAKQELVELFCTPFIESAYGKRRLPIRMEFSEALASFLGFYVSEGCLLERATNHGVFLSAMNRTTRKKMENSIKDGLRLPYRKNNKGFAIDSFLAFLLVKHVFKCGRLAENKEVPYFVFNSKREVKLAFLKAYFEGDGHVDFKHNRIVFTTTSRKLASGLVLLLRMLGVSKVTLIHDHCYRVNVYEPLPFAKIKSTDGKRSYYNTLPSAFLDSNLFSKFGNIHCSVGRVKSRKKMTLCPKITYDFIRNVEPAPHQPPFVYDITVKDTNVFLGGLGLLAMHNSVAEEGLDIDAVDTVIFYEAVPSEIRAIQRRGRAGRTHAGNAIVLLAKNTKDEAFFWISRRKERQMHDTLDSMSREMSRTRHAQKENSSKSDQGVGSIPSSSSGGQKELGEF